MEEEIRAGKTVTVGCKLPHGLKLDLQVNGEKVRHLLKGTNSSSVVGGFGLTDIPADFWNAWLDKNKDLQFIKAGLVWGYSTRKGAESKAKEEAEKRHGVEALKQVGDQRVAKVIQPNNKADDE